MFYPNRAQWWVLWLTVVPAIFIWINASSGRTQDERLAAGLLIIGALLFWRLSKNRTSK
jgi:hypothetical protein